MALKVLIDQFISPSGEAKMGGACAELDNFFLAPWL